MSKSQKSPDFPAFLDEERMPSIVLTRMSMSFMKSINIFSLIEHKRHHSGFQFVLYKSYAVVETSHSQHSLQQVGNQITNIPFS